MAITLIRHRLRDTCSPGIEKTYTVIGEPVSLPDAETLAEASPYRSQWWALGLVGARPVEQEKGANRGIVGWLYFHDNGEVAANTQQIFLSVKAGTVTVSHLRDLRGVLDREKAEIGVLICLEEPTKPMRPEAAGAGFYDPHMEEAVSEAPNPHRGRAARREGHRQSPVSPSQRDLQASPSGQGAHRATPPGRRAGRRLGVK